LAALFPLTYTGNLEPPVMRALHLDGGSHFLFLLILEGLPQPLDLWQMPLLLLRPAISAATAIAIGIASIAIASAVTTNDAPTAAAAAAADPCCHNCLCRTLHASAWCKSS